MNMTLSAVHFAQIAAMPAKEQAAFIVAMTPVELKAFARYLDNAAGIYYDDLAADYVPPTPESLLELAQSILFPPEPNFDAEYEDWLEEVNAQELDDSDACDLDDTPFFTSRY